ncbi:tetratricopeptide repeat protein [Paraburkholderia sp.]|uniref:tetratricopeptide repeat protein n=1 Tax=Paraburkholderia sp. TaxID=1926495 RepID=UPI003D6E88F1
MTIDTLLLQAATHSRDGHLDLVEPLLRRVVSVEPTNRIACLELARVLILGRRFDEAIGFLDPLASESHNDTEVHRRLGLAHSFEGRNHVALMHYKRVLELEPDDGQILHSVANIEQALGLVDEAAVTYRRAVEVKPFWTMPAVASPPEFRVLWMFAPGAGNTPPDYLIKQARFESHIFTVLKDVEYDVDRLRSHTDVVVNLVSDVDQSRAILGAVETLAERIGRPVVNHPRLIAGTDRASVSRRLMGTPGCVVPATRSFSKEELRQSLDNTASLVLSFPLLIRPAGTHGGENFEQVEDRDQLDLFLSRVDEPHYYVMPFIDYRSEDGYFRKYRFIYVGDEILPYHLAIDDKWKVHHVTTSMADFQWMQDEERAFLDDPWRVFAAPQKSALRAIRNAIGLDYFGIDCSLTSAGEVVVFEVNATMLVHGENEDFPYKNEAVSRIRREVHLLLARAAASPLKAR